jgi:hypothetical protein
MSYDSPYVVGAYSGGGAPDIFGKVPGAPQLAGMLGTSYANAGALIVVLVIIVVMWLMGWGLFRRDGYAEYSANGAASQRHLSSLEGGYPSDGMRIPGNLSYGGNVKSSFLNSREAPYFPDVSNRILRIENREQEAIRAFNKINQTRVSRGGDDSAPLPWGAFWSEWQATHSNDDDGYSEGMAMRTWPRSDTAVN